MQPIRNAGPTPIRRDDPPGQDRPDQPADRAGAEHDAEQPGLTSR